MYETAQLSDHPLLASFLSLVIPYFDFTELPNDIAALKIKEVISILRTIDPGIDNVLANRKFNLPLDKSSYLTGCILATSKRDFRKIFSMSPQRWLTRKRIELAHFQTTQRGSKPIGVYYEVGFEDLSHFSYAFKKQFGYTRTQFISQ